MLIDADWLRARTTVRKRRASFQPQVELLEDRRMMSVDAVLDWNAIALDAVKDDYDVGANPEQGGPGRTARALAIVHVAMHDAVMAINHTYDAYLFPFHAPPGTSIDAAVAQAAHDTLAALFPGQKAMFDAELATSLYGIPTRAAKLGVQLGSRVAQKVLMARASDGADGPMDYTPGTLPGQYRPDPLHPDQMMIGPDWNMVRTFVLASGSQFPAPPPPALTSQEYADAFNQVKMLGGDGVTTPTSRTAEQTEIGMFWAYDGVQDVGTPPRLYNQIARVIAEQQGNSEVENARLFALLNVAMHDAGVASWTTKYQDDFWRPITGIREADPGTGPSGLGDGNPNTIGDPNWTPLGAPASNQSGTNFTPPFPAYTSGHATFGAAAFGILRNYYGTDNIAFTFTSDEMNGVTTDWAGNVRPLAPRSFTSFSQAARENADSRIYLGIHWQFDADQGLIQGTKVADWVFAHFAAHRPHPLLNHFVHFVDTFGIATRRLVDRLTDIVDRVFATTNFQPLTPSTAQVVAPAKAPVLPAMIGRTPGLPAAKPAAGISLDFVNAMFTAGPSESLAAQPVSGILRVKR